MRDYENFNAEYRKRGSDPARFFYLHLAVFYSVKFV